MGLDVEFGEEQVAVRIGWTSVVFERREYAGALHLAFNIPSGTFDDARRWIGERAVIMSREGADEFAGPAGWNSRSVYFEGAEGQVLELIERQVLPASAGGGLLCVSEVGVAVPDVAAAVAGLLAAGVDPYGDFRTDGFVPVGDADGMVIVVEPGRTWLPTADRTAEPVPVTITADVPRRVTLAPGVEVLPHRG